MKIVIQRIKQFPDCTIGELYFEDNNNSNLFCNTLEDVVRPISEKIYGNTAIPAGEYIVIIDYSNRFKKEMPHILKPDFSELANFKGIRIHPGNTAKDTEGCILVGIWDKKSPYIMQSKITFDKFMNIIVPILNKEKKIFLTIKDTLSEGKA